jgi:hypothetical protein
MRKALYPKKAIRNTTPTKTYLGERFIRIQDRKKQQTSSQTLVLTEVCEHHTQSVRTSHPNPDNT